MSTQEYGFRMVEGVDLTFKNNTTTPLTSADKGKPVKVIVKDTAEIELCANGDTIDGIVTGVDEMGVTVRVAGVAEANPLAADGIISTTTSCYVLAGTGGTVKTNGTAANGWRCLAYNAAKNKVYICR